jgi:hypothetical protein
VVVELVDDPPGSADPFTALEPGCVPGAGVVVSAVAAGRLEAAQESVLGVYFRQARLDDLTRVFGGDEVRFDDPAEVVLRVPRWPLLPVDDFLAAEVGSA